jgi:hypothetical protein
MANVPHCGQGAQDFEIRYLKQAMVVAEQGWRTMPGMNETALTAETVPVAVIIQRTALDNPWVSEKWEAHGIVYDEGLPGAAEPRIIVDRATCPRFCIRVSACVSSGTRPRATTST